MKKHLLNCIARCCRTSLLMTAVMAGMSLTAKAADTKYINSQADWEDYVKNYDGKECNVFLNCDVKFETKGIQMDDFVGTLDGQGHAFIFNYKDNKSGDQNAKYYNANWGDDSAPFEDASGTIKNLRLTGTIAIRYGFSAYRESNPLVRALDNTLTIENCHSEIAFVNTGNQASGWNRCHIGGFIGQVNSGAKITFRNCSFTGSFTYTDHDSGHDYNDTGGFIGWLSTKDIVIENCFSYVTYDDRGKVNTFSYFVGNPSSYSDDAVINSYGYCVNSSGEVKSLTNADKCTDLTTGNSEIIGNGLLTLALNGDAGKSESKWAQTVGTDATPKLKTFNPSSNLLYNLVTNGYFNNDNKGWTLEKGTAAVLTDNNNKFWRTGRFVSVLTQTVNLADYLTETELAGNTYNALLSCNVGDQYGYAVLIVKYTFLDANGTTIGTDYELINKSSYLKLDAFTWETTSATISMPVGTRKVTVTLQGRDEYTWEGYFGPAFDNVVLALVKTGEIPTGITMPARRPAASSARRYTIDGTPAGKDAKGIIIQNGKKYLVR